MRPPEWQRCHANLPSHHRMRARRYMGGGDWACNVLRLWAGEGAAVESEWTVGPIPVADGNGKEVVMRLSAGAPAWNGSSPPELWTDSNGLEMQVRGRVRRYGLGCAGQTHTQSSPRGICC